MEYLDTYDEKGNFLKPVERSIVHKEGLWHKTIHCWLYDKEGNVYFQVRRENNKLYTTASGHVQAGETLQQAFAREIKEEIGIEINYEEAQFITMVPFLLDRLEKNGSTFKDRAFANVYCYEYKGNNKDFHLDATEVNALVKVNAKETLDLLAKESGTIEGTLITLENESLEKEILFEDFLVNPGETALEKYGKVLHKIISFLN